MNLMRFLALYYLRNSGTKNGFTWWSNSPPRKRLKLAALLCRSSALISLTTLSVIVGVVQLIRNRITY